MLRIPRQKSGSRTYSDDEFLVHYNLQMWTLRRN